MPKRRALEILEDSVSLLREAPAAATAAYLTGAIPFSLALLFFFTDMIRSPFASERLMVESLGVAALLLWKHAWQAVFMARLHGKLSDRLSSPRASAGSIARLASMQFAIQPLRLVVVPLSLLLTVPFASVVAFFRNLALFVALGEPDPIALARRQAALWTRQNWGVLGVMTLAALFLFANVLLLLMILPGLARSFLGIEGDLQRLGVGFFNLTTMAVAASVTWLVIDPLLSAVYVLRCFYGASLATGEDLAAAWRRAIGVMALLLVTICATPRIVLPQTAPPAAGDQPQWIDAGRLDHSIDQTIRRREFTWRSPPAPDQDQGRWTGWLRSVLNAIGNAFGWVLDRIADLFRSDQENQNGKRPASPRVLLEIWTGVVAALLITGAIVFFSRRRRGAVVAVEAPAAAVPAANLADESLTADRLPESSWLRLADESLSRGEYRMALRALYLAGLNYMSQRELISLRRWKSGLDYQRELERRARTNPGVSRELAPVFAQNIALFERGWYGRHRVDRAAVEALMGGLEEMRRRAESA
jgi:hypothetical protein